MDLYDRGSIVFFGDSLIANGRDENSVAKKLSEITNETVFNAAFGGTGMAYTRSDERIAYTKDSYNLIGLSQSILTGDYRVQKNARIMEAGTAYFGTVIFWMEYMDFLKADIILIEQALNDYQSGVPVENPEDPFDMSSYAGAMRVVVDRLRRIKPDYRIILVTPTYTWYPHLGLTCEDYVIEGQILEDFIEKQEELSRELGVEFIDLYHDFYIHEKADDWMRYTVDGVHPSEEARELIARRIAEYLEEQE